MRAWHLDAARYCRLKRQLLVEHAIQRLWSRGSNGGEGRQPFIVGGQEGERRIIPRKDAVYAFARISSLIAPTASLFTEPDRSKLLRIARDRTAAESVSREAMKTGIARLASERATGNRHACRAREY